MTEQPGGWTLGRAVAALRKFWLVIAAATLVAGVVGFAVANATTPVYQARATLLFSISQVGSASDLNQGSTYTQGQMLSYAQLATSSRVLDPVIEELELDTTPRLLARDVQVTIPEGTSILWVQVTSTSPAGSAETANQIAQSLTTAVDALAPTGGQSASPAISAALIDQAVVPEFQSAPNKPRDAVLGALLGFLLAVLAAFVWALVDTRIPDEDTLDDVVDTPLLGTVSRVPRRATGNLFVVDEPLGATSEEFRRIRSALSYVGVSREVERLLVTSSNPSEGKSTFAANLALTLAGLKERVLLIDADLRRPAVAEYFGTEGALGLTSVLIGESTLHEARQPRPGTTLDVLTSGDRVPNPAGLLTSDEMKALLEQSAREYDHVIVDGAPALSVADANLMAPFMDGVILLVDARRTRRQAVQRAVASLEGSGANLVGIVLNRVKRDRRTSDYYLAEPGRGSTRS